MLFNSIEFFLFLPCVFLLYWFILNKNLKQQNFLILIASYFFYGWWDYKFLSLILLSTIVDYFIGLKIENTDNEKKRKTFLWTSILFNLGVLGFFKYFNFFIDSWVSGLNSIGYEIENTWTLSIILPVGISFYTFQTLSYSLDIYKRKLKPTHDFISFASYVSFFPQLVAGPIERASHLLPQILNNRKFNYKQGVQGIRLILWGLFKKVVIADSLAPIVNDIFNNYQNLDGGILWLGILYFSFQIYCDFSGYSDIAIGTSKLFGFELMSNFKFPYFSRNIGEFWRRWHISLSTWFRDYIYIPLGGSKISKWIALRNIFIIFLVSGFWHGANWTFIFWGGIHALLYIPFFLMGTNRKYLSSVVAEKSIIPSIKEIFQIASTFLFVLVAWVFFRSENLSQAFQYIYKMFFEFKIPSENRYGIFYVLVLLIMDWVFRKNEREVFLFKNNILRWFIYIIITLSILHFFGKGDDADFIYFQF